jgi:hypothetical protein
VLLYDSAIKFKSQITNHKSQITNILPHALSPVPRAPCPEPHIRRTPDIIRSIHEGTFPDQAMITLHPQRWNDAWFPWLKELIWQNIKNPAKWLVIKVKV